MSTIAIDNTAKDLPIDDYQEQKVVDYNAVFAALNAAWTSWTPTLSGIAIGTGGSAELTGKFRQIGKLVHCRLFLKFGTSGQTLPTGDFTFTLPVTSVTPAGTATVQGLGRASARDVSAGDVMSGFVVWASTTTIKLRFPLASGTYVVQNASSVPSGSVPFSWATGDEIYLDGIIYEAA